MQGNIGIIHNTAAPYEPKILQLIRAGCTAVLAIRNRPNDNVPGQSMYYITSIDQTLLTIPVVEIFQATGAPNQILSLVKQDSGLYVSVWPQENQWKKTNEAVGYHLTAGIINSLLELIVIAIGAYRLFGWFQSGMQLLSIGPVCILLLMTAASFFFASTFIDPFTTYRIVHFTGAMILVTGGLPFFFTSGILLTFFWAETLAASKIQAVPFISEYKWPAAIAIFVLFAAEISCTAALITIPVSNFNPAYITQVINLIVAIVLTVCYIMCAKKIAERLKEYTTPSHKKSSKKQVRAMTIRFTASTAGYIAFVILMILTIPYVETPWPYKIIMHLLYLSVNLASILQVWTFKPPKRRSKSSSGNGSFGSHASPQSPRPQLPPEP